MNESNNIHNIHNVIVLLGTQLNVRFGDRYERVTLHLDKKCPAVSRNKSKYFIKLPSISVQFYNSRPVSS
jgi:hypothetical protein